MYTINSAARRSAPRRGYIMLLVLIGVFVAFIVGMTFLAGATSTTNIATTLGQHSQAQRSAESGVALAMGYIAQTPAWRTARSSGAWLTNYNLNGATISIDGTYVIDPNAGPITVNDPSFEAALGQLANPFSSPPMSGTVGGWQLTRTCTLQFGPVVPRIGVTSSAAATDGSHVGFVSFPVVLAGTGVLSQTLADTLLPDSTYVLGVDVGTAGLAALISNVEIRVLAGATQVASSSDSSALLLLDLGGGFQRYVVRFTTDSSPPGGAITIELRAATLIGVISAVAFDNVHFEIADMNPLVLTVESRLDNTSHVVQATAEARYGSFSPYRVVEWDEP